MGTAPKSLLLICQAASVLTVLLKNSVSVNSPLTEAHSVHRLLLLVGSVIPASVDSSLSLKARLGSLSSLCLHVWDDVLQSGVDIAAGDCLSH